ncbi:hypothetical protein [Stutzerimonas nitrititolerans]|uniref:hypothetical protein n=1 Tax=Stutzerimonas nitrititolerans TaxID=2482751 RepID=UPI00289B81AA|nr:hypothetical protein [Stutzerimonas nitrititolerans]
MIQQTKPLRRPPSRSRVPGILRMSQMTGMCDICNRHRSQGNHVPCSAQRQAKYRHLWEAQQ